MVGSSRWEDYVKHANKDTDTIQTFGVFNIQR